MIRGFVTGTVKGGLTVDIGVIKAFLPGSLVDERPVKDFDFLHRARNRSSSSLRWMRLEIILLFQEKPLCKKLNSADREALIERLDTGKDVEGIVKNIADYGAFVDLGGVDGLLHITDISWQRVNHPSEKLTIGDKINSQNP